MNDVEVVVTGLGWLGQGVRSVNQALFKMLSDATREVLITAYSLTVGAEVVWEELRKAMQRGVVCKLVAHDVPSQRESALEILKNLQAEYPATLSLFDFTPREGGGELHAKIVVVDRMTALVGSANISLRGVVRSHELAVIVHGGAAAAVGDRIDQLIGSPYVRPLRLN